MSVIDSLLGDVLARFYIEEARYATFETIDFNPEIDSPDDAPAGRVVVEKLVAAVRLPPLASVSRVQVYNDYGWDLEIQHGGACIWCMLQRSDAWLLITQARPSLVDRLRGLDFAKQHQEVTRVLDEALHSLEVADLRWYSHAEFLAFQAEPKRSV